MARMLRRGVYAIPVLGRITREVAEGDTDNKWYLAVILLTLWILAGMTWGLPAVVVPFVMAAPLCLVMLILLTRG
jgi:flagellar biosynthesis component FlhA